MNVHGNPILENIIIEEPTQRVVMIDPYEEGACTLALLDERQALQPSWANYELRNGSGCEVDIELGRANCSIDVPEGVRAFDKGWYELLSAKYEATEILWIHLPCATQFIRMLSYKVTGSEEHCLYFFGVGIEVSGRLRSFARIKSISVSGRSRDYSAEKIADTRAQRRLKEGELIHACPYPNFSNDKERFLQRVRVTAYSKRGFWSDEREDAQQCQSGARRC